MKFLSLVLWLTTFPSTVYAIGQQTIISIQQSPGSLRLATRNSAVRIIVEDDFGRVTGLNGSVSSARNLNDSLSLNLNASFRPSLNRSAPFVREGVIIVGTLGKSPLIDDLAKNGKIKTEHVVGEWEAFTSSVVESPVPGVARALVIAGSDRRGTVYGIYDISEQIGVSPWHWFSDVPSKPCNETYALNITKIQPSPSIKYRGFFINDEAPALTGWMNAKYPKGPHGSSFGAEFYCQVFELLLRLRANYLWPAMWGSMFNMDDPRNQKLAHEFGIVMGTSHTEPMMRATKEQNEFMNGPWQWDVNNASMYSFMLEGARRAREYESVFTMGARGNHDTALNGGDAIKQLEGIFKAQREILGDVYGDVKKVSQVWTLYTEVQNYYDEDGLKVPDDVTLLWADDNFGNMRRLPAESEWNRTGGAGIYYHFDFVGPPRSYKWINTIQLQKTWEQMYAAYQRHARRIWVVNVGDIKGLEIPTSHFFDLAYDITLYTHPNSTFWWLQQWATREFGSEQAKDIAAMMLRYSNLAGKRKFELVDSSTYSVTNYDEGDRILAEWHTMSKNAQHLSDKLPDEAKAAFFEMISHPIFAAGNHYEIAISSAKNQLYAFQGRNSANVLAGRVSEKWRIDHELMVRYHGLLGGKWEHVMDQPHFYNNYWQQPMRQLSPQLQYIQPLERSLSGDMGIAIEGSNASIPGDDRFHTNSANYLTMLPIDPFATQPRWFEIFAQGTNSFTFNISVDAFAKVTHSSGTISPTGNGTDIRVYICIDWSKAPTGFGVTRINITSSSDYGTQYSSPYLLLPYNHTFLPRTFTEGYVESGGVIAIEAEHYSHIKNGSSMDLTYTVLPDYGKTLSGVSLSSSSIALSLEPETAPYLEYNVFTFTPSSPFKPAKISAILSPSLNTTPLRPLRYAISIDSQPPQIIQFVKDKAKAAQAGGWPNGMPIDWEKAVVDGAWTSVTEWEMKSGAHTVKFWALEPGVVLQRVVIDLGGLMGSYLGPPENWRISSKK